jgi:translocation and assembly module TamA
MPTLQIKHCPRQPVVTLLAFVLAQFAAPANADVEIEIRGVGENIRANVLAYLSFERYKSSDDLSPEFVERLQERSEREVRGALRPFGYYDPVITSEVTREGSGSDQDYSVVINIKPGTPVVVDKVDVNVTGPGAREKVFTDITGDMQIQAGDTLDHANYEALKGALLRTAATNGYLDARMLRNEMRVDPQAHTAQIEIEIETGERYRFGTTTIQQDSIDDALVRRYVRYHENDYFDATELLRTQFALDDSQYFSTVEVLPEERDRDSHIVPVSIVAEPNRRHRYSYGVGYGTDTQVRGTVAWEDRRVNRRGHRFRTEAKAADTAQSLDTRYVVPIGDPATEKFTLQLTGEHERLGDIDDRSVNFIPSITHVRGPWFGHYWQRVMYVEFLHAESEFIASNRTDVQSLLIPGISFSLVPRKYLGEALFSRSLYAELRGSHSALGSDSDFLQVRMQAEHVFDIAPKWHVLVRADLGATAVSRTSTLAPSQRFFAGGDRSVRGFGFNDLSPVEQATDENGNPLFDEDGDPVHEKVGGKHLFAGSVELIRDVGSRFAVAVFGDAGNAFDSFDDPLMYSAGIGVRLRLPVVSVGLDVAQALTTPAGSSEPPGPRVHLNFSPKL